MEMQVDAVHTVKLEDGDVLHVVVPIGTHPKQVRAFREYLVAEAQEKIGDRVIVIVTASDPGTVEAKVIKCDMKDVYRRLDALESNGLLCDCSYSDSDEMTAHATLCNTRKGGGK